MYSIMQSLDSLNIRIPFHLLPTLPKMMALRKDLFCCLWFHWNQWDIVSIICHAFSFKVPLRLPVRRRQLQYTIVFLFHKKVQSKQKMLIRKCPTVAQRMWSATFLQANIDSKMREREKQSRPRWERGKYQMNRKQPTTNQTVEKLQRSRRAWWRLYPSSFQSPEKEDKKG